MRWFDQELKCTFQHTSGRFHMLSSRFKRHLTSVLIMLFVLSFVLQLICHHHPHQSRWYIHIWQYVGLRFTSVRYAQYCSTRYVSEFPDYTTWRRLLRYNNLTSFWMKWRALKHNNSSSRNKFVHTTSTFTPKAERFRY